MGGYYGGRLIGTAQAGSIAATKGKTGMTAFDFEFVSIDGAPLKLADFAGRPLLVVNTASFCGYTPQYTGLEELWQAYKDKGLVLVGVPSDDFGQQEPGTNAEIKEFCDGFDVSFPLAEKNVVVGAKAHPFYRWLAQELGEGALPRWNFFKYLIGRDGRPRGAWPSRVEPMSAEMRKAIDAALAEKPDA
ncbi:MAG: glutathione peroxidase [Proteobacteria bacterium]|nr:glutathione peroxidase [Pseudomonadota bacterium]